METVVCDLIHLIASALHDTTPQNAPDNLEAVMELAEAQSVSVMAATALSYLADKIPASLYNSIQERAAKTVWKLSMMDAEREKVLSFLEENQIWYMPLKGAVLQNLYPSPELREMCDSDILYDASRRDDVLSFLKSENYTVSTWDIDAADSFLKLPCYNLEMHRMLFENLQDGLWQDYYQDVKNRLVKDPGNLYGYHFSDEDFYIYLILHSFKHHLERGTGIRFLADCYVYLLQKQNTLDWNYIEQEEKYLGSLEFEKLVRQVSMKLFSNAEEIPELAPEELELLDQCIRSDTYGTIERFIENGIQAKKISLLLSAEPHFPSY